MLDVVFVIIALGTGAGWAVTLYKFMPLYKVGHYTPTYNRLLGVLVALLVWESLMLLAIALLRSVWLATMLSVLWTVAALGWATLATLRSTQRTMQVEQQAQGVAGYTVRKTPRPTPAVQPAQAGSYVSARPGAGAARSARVRRIMAMETEGAWTRD